MNATTANNAVDATKKIHRFKESDPRDLRQTGESGETDIATSRMRKKSNRKINIDRGPEDSRDSPDSPRVIGPPPRHRYATADAPTRPVYTPGDDALPLNDDPHLASCDVMVLTFAARRHAEHLATLRGVTRDVVNAIRADLEAIATAIATSADVGPRSRTAAQVAVEPPGLFAPTRANTGQRGPTQRVTGRHAPNVDDHVATDATNATDESNRCNK